ncbi:hypothetical protein CE91St19_13980 [Odoribacter laneus]|nr:hypothetical protein CE91St19_13980 [Odoribacter laneus]GKI24439.1 hypothetical protein CE91St20_05760 [Odoribacter laneus]
MIIKRIGKQVSINSFFLKKDLYLIEGENYDQKKGTFKLDKLKLHLFSHK